MNWISLMLICAVFFSFQHLVSKKVLEEVPADHFTALLYPAGFLLLIPFAGRVDFSIGSLPLFLIFLTAVSGISGAYLLNVAYRHCEISTVAPLLNLNPILVMAWAFIFLKESITLVQFTGVLFIFFGGYLLTLKDITRFFHPFTSLAPRFFLITFAALVLWSVNPIIGRYVLLTVDSFSYMFWFAFFISLCALIGFGPGLARQKVRWSPRALGLIALAAGFWIVSDTLQLAALAIPGCVVSLMMPIKRVSNLFTVIFGGRIFRESNLLVKSMACMAMLAGLFIIGLNTD